MIDTFHHRMHSRGKQVQSALFTAGVLIFTVLAIVILFLGVLVTRAH